MSDVVNVVEGVLQGAKEQTMNHKTVAGVEHLGKATDMAAVRYEGAELDMEG